MKTKSVSSQELTLFTLTWPIFIETGLHMSMGIIATLMLGRYLDSAAAGVGVANQIINLFILVFNVTSIGATILISQKLGARDDKRAEKIAHSVLFLNFWFGLIISAIVLFLGKQFLLLFNIHGQIFFNGLVFIQICGASLFLESLTLALSAILRSHGFTKDAMIVTILMDMISVSGNILATSGIFGLPVTGVHGVAWAMFAARIFATCALVVFIRLRLKLKFSLKDLYRGRKNDIHALLSIGIPSAGEGLSYQLSQLIITAVVVMIGTAALAARVYLLNITMLCFLFTVAIAQGTQLLIGRYIGGSQWERAYQRGMRTVKIATCVSSLASLAIATFGGPILGLFTASSTIFAVGLPTLWINVLSEPGRAINIVLMGSLKSAGDVRFPVLIGIVSMWTIATGFSYLFGVYYGLGLAGVWIAQGADEWFRALFALRRWHSRPWKKFQEMSIQG